MLQRIIGFVIAIAGLFVALVVGIWAIVSLLFVAAGAALVYAIRNRGRSHAHGRGRREVIEGEFEVMDDASAGGAQKRADERSGPQ